MPELPDVEVFRRTIDTSKVKVKISHVEVNVAKLVKGSTGKEFASRLTGKTFKKIWRHGKNLFLDTDNSESVLLHFGMTGRPEVYSREQQDEPAYTAVRFDFENGYSLAYTNKRKLGKVGLIDSPGDYISRNVAGTDATRISEEQFGDALGKGNVKTSLMNQDHIAGIGNIYADEILYQARIHPERTVEDLSGAERHRLYKAMHHVITTAVEKEADPSKMPRSFLLFHRRGDKKCPSCHERLSRAKIGGRTTYYCNSCQK